MTREATFETSKPILVPSRRLIPIGLQPKGAGSPHVDWTDAGIVFRTDGWYEVLMTVDWDPSNRAGTRFSHTKIPDQHPLHSEAINAAVLADISGGRQLLRGNSLFGPDRTTSLVLEVWQDSGERVELRAARLVVRELQVGHGANDE